MLILSAPPGTALRSQGKTYLLEVKYIHRAGDEHLSPRTVPRIWDPAAELPGMT